MPIYILIAVFVVAMSLFFFTMQARWQAETEMERARFDAAAQADRMRSHRYHHVCDRCRTEVRSDWIVRRCVACRKPYAALDGTSA